MVHGRFLYGHRHWGNNCCPNNDGHSREMLNILEVVKVQLHLLTNDKKMGAKALSYRNVKKLQDYMRFEAESQRLWVLFISG